MNPINDSTYGPKPRHNRDCTQLELTLILGIDGKRPEKRQKAIELYNEDKQPHEQLKPVRGRVLPMRMQELLLYRGQLPESVEIYLDSFESKLKCPYTNGFQFRA